MGEWVDTTTTKGILATANILNSISKNVSYLNMWKSPMSFELHHSSNRLKLNWGLLYSKHYSECLACVHGTPTNHQEVAAVIILIFGTEMEAQLAWAHSHTRILNSYLYLHMFSLSLEETSLMVLVIAIFWGGEPDNWGTEGQRWEEVCFPLKTFFLYNFWSPSFTLLRIFKEPDT